MCEFQIGNMVLHNNKKKTPPTLFIFNKFTHEKT